AQDLRLDRPVAVKMIRKDHWQDQEQGGFAESFENEAKIAAKLMHPGIAAIHDYGFHSGTPFAVFEFVSGSMLRDVIRSRAPLPLADVQTILARLSEALDYA